MTHVLQMRADAPDRLVDDADRFAGGDERKKSSRDLEREIVPRRRNLVVGGGRFDARGALDRIEPAAGVDRPLQVETRAVVVRNVRIDDAELVVRKQHAEDVDMVRAGVARLSGHLRQHRGVTLGRDRRRRVTARHRFRQAMTGVEPATDRLVERQRQRRGRGLRLAVRGARRDGDGEHQARDKESLHGVAL